jgi:hypothetical protein
MEFTVKRSSVVKQPSTDYIVILHPYDMEKLKVETNDYVNLQNTVYGLGGEKKLEISAQVFGVENYPLSLMTAAYDNEPVTVENLLFEGEAGVDQTYREALGLRLGQKVTISKAERKHRPMERLVTRLDYQKAIVRVQGNAAYFERKTPVVCLCDEVMTSIGVNYGDKIEVEYKDNRTVVKCAKLIPGMQLFHDLVLNPQSAQRNKLPERYLKYPEDFGIVSDDLEWGGITHPIFMDGIAMHSLGVGPLDPVKIRKSFKWQILKALNRFGSVSVIAFSVLLGLLLEHIQQLSIPVAIGYGAVIGALLGWGAWSILTSSGYKTSNESP